MSAPAFQFYPKQWLGDDMVLAMDWDARAMHMHLICIAWQQSPPCTLPDDDDIIRRWLGKPQNWEELKKQIFRAWKLVDGRWLQSGLLEQYNRQKDYRDSRKAGAKARWNKTEKRNAHASEMQCITDALQSSSSTSEVISEAKASSPRQSPAGSDPSPEELIYRQYPRRVGHRVAVEAIKKAIFRLCKGEDQQPMGKYEAQKHLFRKVQAFARSPAGQRPDQELIPHPSTWFNQSRYMDDEATWQLSSNGGHASNGNGRKTREELNNEKIEAALKKLDEQEAEAARRCQGSLSP